jgi:hypothetical protein
MKGHLLPVFAFAVIAIGVLQPSVGAPVLKGPAKPIVKVNGDTLFINGKAVPLPGERKNFVELLGKPSRELESANTLLVWDELGIVIYEGTVDKKISQVNVALGELDLSYWPKERFRGRLTLDGVTIAADTTIEAINRERKGKTFEPGKLGVGWSIEFEKLHVSIDNAKNRNFNDDGTIAEFIVGSK